MVTWQHLVDSTTNLCCKLNREIVNVKTFLLNLCQQSWKTISCIFSVIGNSRKWLIQNKFSSHRMLSENYFILKQDRIVGNNLILNIIPSVLNFTYLGSCFVPSFKCWNRKGIDSVDNDIMTDLWIGNGTCGHLVSF
jgi:hypothetical protein